MTIPVGGVVVPEKTLTADIINVGPEGSRCTLSGGDILALGISTNCLAVEVIRLAGTEVLYPTVINNKESIAVTYSDGSTGTIEAFVHSKVCHINAEQHLLTCQLEFKTLTKALKQVIIPTGLDFSHSDKTDSHNTTAVLVNKTDLLLGLVHIYVESNYLYVKVVFTETPSYTSMLIRINIVFN